MDTKLKLNPWFSIWLHPRDTINEIIATNWNHHFYFLSAIYGFSLILSTAQNFSLGLIMPVGFILIMAAIFAVFVGYIGISVSSAVLYWTGKWIGGKGEYNDIRCAVAWSNVPNALQIFLWFVLILLFGFQVFDQRFADTNFTGPQLGIVITLFLGQAVLGVWSFLILLQTLGEVQGFSAWKALLNVFIPIGILVGIFWFIGLFIS